MILHLAVYDFLLVEAERKTVDAVFHFVKETLKTSAENRKADKILIEKVIHALLLLEGLVESGLPSNGY